jgi:hypothetical protein
MSDPVPFEQALSLGMALHPRLALSVRVKMGRSIAEVRDVERAPYMAWYLREMMRAAQFLYQAGQVARAVEVTP